MSTARNSFGLVLSGIVVALAGAVVVSWVVFGLGASRLSAVTGELEETEQALDEAQLENDSLTAEVESNVIEWRNAEGRIAFAGDGEGLVCHLTFSGGPSSQTKKNLAILEEEGAVATWFCYADEETVEGLDLSLVKKIEKQGSTIGVLGYSQSEIYESYWGTLDEYLSEDFTPAKAALEEATGHDIDICRFPGGTDTIAYYNTSLVTTLPAEVLEMGMQFFDWNVSGGDFNADATTDEIVDNVVSAAEKYAKRDSSICVALADGPDKQTTTKALPAIITALSEMGYTFETLDNDSAGYYMRDVSGGKGNS